MTLPRRTFLALCAAMLGLPVPLTPSPASAWVTPTGFESVVFAFTVGPPSGQCTVTVHQLTADERWVRMPMPVTIL